MGNGTNDEKDQTERNRMEANKSFAYSILMNLSTICELKIVSIEIGCELINFYFAGRTYTKSFDSLLERYGAYEIIDFVIQHLTKHPFLAFSMLICVLACALPFIIFMVFAIATVVMTFTGFVIIEGQSCFCLPQSVHCTKYL